MGNPEDTSAISEHVIADLHECARILHRIDKLIDQFIPMAQEYAASPSMAGMFGAARRARKAGKQQ